MLGLGLFVGLFLGVAAIVFKVKVNEQEEAVLKALPGNNCGGCGFPGCAGLAAAIAKGEAPVNQCPVGGEPVANEIAKIMGTEAAKTERQVAFVACDTQGAKFIPRVLRAIVIVIGHSHQSMSHVRIETSFYA